MKNNLKITVLAVLSAFLLISCSTAVEPEYFDASFYPEDDEITLDGMIFRLGSHWIDQFYTDIGITESGDKMRARYDEIEKRFNVKMEFLGTGNCETGNILANYIADLPENIPDIMDIAGDQAYGMYKSDMLYPFDEISTININDEKFGHTQFIAPGTSWGGHRWGAVTNNWQIIPQFPSILIFNNMNLRARGFSNAPYELMESGEWTWANFENILEGTTYTNEEGNLQKSFNVRFPDWFCETVILSNGGKLVDESGDVPKFAMGSPEAIEALEWAASLVTNGWAEATEKYNSLTEGYSFDFEESYIATNFASEADYGNCLEDYGVAPFPWGPKAEYGVTSSSLIHGNRRFFVANALSENDMDSVGIVMDLLFDPLEGDEECAWKKNLHYILHHDEDMENFITMCDNVNYTYSLEFGAEDAKIRSNLGDVFRGESSASEFIASVTDLANAALAESVK